MNSTGSPGASAATRSAFPVLLVAVLMVFTAQQTLIPAFPPLVREVGLSELALGAVMSFGAVFFAAASPLWGRAVDAWGQRRVLLSGLGFALFGLLGFALVSQAALAGALPAPATLALMLATRSVFFGIGVGAVPVAAMAYVAATTDGGPARTSGMGRIGAMQGAAMALGPALGGLLAFGGLLGPLWLAPAIVAFALAAVALVVPAPARTGPSGPQRREPGPRPWDRRFWPFLVVGFLAFLSLGMTLMVVGFLVQDRLGLDAAATVRAAGLVSFAAGLVLIAVQGVLVPWLARPPLWLLRAGLPVAALALLGLAAAPSLAVIAAAMATLAFGLGLAIPGYTAAPTLRAHPHEYGAVAGLVQATTGATFVVAPLAGTALYAVGSGVPALTGAAAAALATLFVYTHSGVRDPAEGPAAPIERAGNHDGDAAPQV